MKIYIGRGLSWTGGILAILLLLGSIAFFLLPYIIKWQANNWFEDQGLVSSIDDVEIRLMDGQFIVRKLVVNDSAGVKQLNVGYLLVQLSLRDLFDKKVIVEKVNAGDLYIGIEQDQLGLLKVAGVGAGTQAQPLNNDSTTENDEKESKTTKVSSVSESDAWHFLLGEIQISKLETCYRIAETASSRAYHSCATLDAFGWQGYADYTLYPEPDISLSEFKAVFDFGLYGLTVRDVKLDRTIMRFDTLSFSGVRANGIDNIQIKQILLDKYFALQTKPIESSSQQADYLLSSNRLVTSDIVLEDLSRLDINALNINGLTAKLQINPDGSLEINNVIREFSLPVRKLADKETKKPEAQAANPMSFRLGELLVDGGSSLSMKDESVKPAFDNKLSKVRITLQDIDMSDQAGDTRVDISLMAGEHGEIDTKGTIQLFAAKPTLALKVKLVGINVSDFDAYAHKIVQHKVKSGHLDANIDIKIDKGNLDASSKVTLHKFYVDTLGEKEAGQYKEKLGIPLSSALSLLRERDDSISIKMPVTGDVENPNFSLADIIRQVSILAIKQAVISYYTPFGLVKLLTKGFDLATALRFEPVLFDASRSDIDDQDKEQMDKLARLLTERPRIHLVFCGHATREDFNKLFPEEAKKIKALLDKKKKEVDSEEGIANAAVNKVEVPITDKARKKLDELAVSRGKAVTQYLEDKYKIAPDRLILCNPEFDYSDDGQMRVEISI